MIREYVVQVKSSFTPEWTTEATLKRFDHAQNVVRGIVSEGTPIEEVRIVERTETVIELPVSAGLTEPEDA